MNNDEIIKKFKEYLTENFEGESFGRQEFLQFSGEFTLSEEAKDLNAIEVMQVFQKPDTYYEIQNWVNNDLLVSREDGQQNEVEVSDLKLESHTPEQDTTYQLAEPKPAYRPKVKDVERLNISEVQVQTEVAEAQIRDTIVTKEEMLNGLLSNLSDNPAITDEVKKTLATSENEPLDILTAMANATSKEDLNKIIQEFSSNPNIQSIDDVLEVTTEELNNQIKQTMLSEEFIEKVNNEIPKVAGEQAQKVMGEALEKAKKDLEKQGINYQPIELTKIGGNEEKIVESAKVTEGKEKLKEQINELKSSGDKKIDGNELKELLEEAKEYGIQINSLNLPGTHSDKIIVSDKGKNAMTMDTDFAPDVPSGNNRVR